MHAMVVDINQSTAHVKLGFSGLLDEILADVVCPG